jgi:hypothetical protein
MRRHEVSLSRVQFCADATDTEVMDAIADELTHRVGGVDVAV